jgi:polyferredoxin
MTTGTPEELSGAAGRLRRAAVGAAAAGAVGSVVFTLMVGRHNQSWILLGMFVGWVLAPFIGFGLADRRSRRWSGPARTALHTITLAIALGSLLIYGAVALGPPRPQPAAFFLMVPLGSWVLALVAVPLVALVSRGRRPAK